MNYDPLRSHPTFTPITEAEFKHWVEDTMDYRLSGWSDGLIAYDRNTSEVLGFKTNDNQHYINPELLKDLQDAERKGKGLRGIRQQTKIAN